MADSSGRINLDGNNVMLELAWYNSKAGLTSAAVGRRWFGPSYSRPDDPGTGVDGTVDQAGLNNDMSEHEVVNKLSAYRSTRMSEQDRKSRTGHLVTSRAVTKPATCGG